MPIKHAFTSGKSDPGDTTLVKPSDWNANHTAPYFDCTYFVQFANATWTDMPSALTEFNGSSRYRFWVDLTYATEMRLCVSVGVAGEASAELRVQYSLDNSSFSYVDNVSGPAVSISAGGLYKSSWVSITAAAKADVVLRVIGINGNGATDPSFGAIHIQYR